MITRLLTGWFLLALGTTVLGAEQAAPDGPTTHVLRYKFQPGQVLHFQRVQQVDIDITIKERTQQATNQTTSVQRWRVLGVDEEGVAEIELSTQKLQMQATDGKNSVEFDSEDPEKQPARYSKVADAIGKVLSVVRLSPTGKVLKREVKIDKPDQTPGAETPMTLPLPTEPVAVGDKWYHRFSMKLARRNGERFEVPARQTFALEKVQDGVATISYETIVLAPVREPGLEVQLIQRQPAGEIRFDLDRGLVVSQEHKTDETVVGYAGPGTAFHFTSTFSERLQPEPATADVQP